MRVLIRLRQFAALGANERQLLVLSLVLVAHVRAALCVLPSRLSLRLVRHIADLPARHSRAHPPAPTRIAWAIGAVSRLVPRATCLTQAVAGNLLLRFYGYESRLCLGVARTHEGGFFAHAWIEREGCILIGGPQSAAFTQLSPPGSVFRQHPSAGAP